MTEPSDIEIEQGSTERASDADDRVCVACGYSLRGLGESPRCPECGLLNVPDAYRKQVHELIDSGKHFFSGPFSFIHKRPPGWWWSLDRPGDVKKSVRFALFNAATALAIVVIASVLCCGVIIETKEVTTYRISGEDAWVRATVSEIALFHSSIRPIAPTPHASGPTGTKTSLRTFFRFRFQALPIALLLFIAAVVAPWSCPAFVGLATQIRRGLPEFARPPRTIFAAANYESHRLLYNAIATSFYLASSLLTLFLLVSNRLRPTMTPWFLGAIFAMCVVYIPCGWIGPLRTDFTRQLIRSKWHAARIILMYAAGLPVAIGFTIGLIAAYWDK